MISKQKITTKGKTMETTEDYFSSRPTPDFATINRRHAIASAKAEWEGALRAIKSIIMMMEFLPARHLLKDLAATTRWRARIEREAVEKGFAILDEFKLVWDEV